MCDSEPFLGYCSYNCLGADTNAIALKHIPLKQTRDGQKFPWDLYFNQLRDPKINRPYGMKFEAGYARPTLSCRPNGYSNSIRWDYDVDAGEWIESPHKSLFEESKAFKANVCRAKKTPYTLCNSARVRVFGYAITNPEHSAWGGSALLVSVTQDLSRVRAFPVNSVTVNKPWVSDSKPTILATSIDSLSIGLDFASSLGCRATQNEVLLKVMASDIIGIRQLYDNAYSRLESILRVCQVYFFF